MNKLFTIITIILSISLINAFADSNGIWHKAEDIRSGEFALDEDGGNFKFPRNLEINNNLSIASNLFISGNPSHNSYIIGNLGIGTSNPNNKLSVQTNTGNSIIGISSNSQYSAIDFYNNAINKWGIGKDNLDNFYIDEFGVANRVIIKQGTGFMGLGTYDPRAELEVNGNIIAKNLRLDNGSGPIDLDDIYVNEGQLNSITSPMIVDGTIIGADINPNFYLWSKSGTNIYSLSNNVGIGTNAPSSILHIKDSKSGVNGDILLGSQGNYDGLDMVGMQIERSTGMKTYYGISGATGTAGGMAIKHLNAGAEFYLENTNSLNINGINVPIKFFTSDSGVSQNRMEIGKTGNVGIGTTLPSARLHVNGNIIANNPIQNNHVATKEYVDNSVSGVGGTLNYFKTATNYFTYTHTNPNQFNGMGTSATCPTGSYLISCTFCKSSGCNPTLTGLSVDRNFAEASSWVGQVEYYSLQSDSRTCTLNINAMFPSDGYSSNGWKTSIEDVYGVAAWCMSLS